MGREVEVSRFELGDDYVAQSCACPELACAFGPRTHRVTTYPRDRNVAPSIEIPGGEGCACWQPESGIDPRQARMSALALAHDDGDDPCAGLEPGSPALVAFTGGRFESVEIFDNDSCSGAHVIEVLGDVIALDEGRPPPRSARPRSASRTPTNE